MFNSRPPRPLSRSLLTGLAVAAPLSAPAARADTIQANADAIATAPGTAQVVLNLPGGGEPVLLEGATDFLAPNGC